MVSKRFLTRASGAIDIIPNPNQRSLEIAVSAGSSTLQVSGGQNLVCPLAAFTRLEVLKLCSDLLEYAQWMKDAD